jgi:hypothetical protein
VILEMFRGVQNCRKMKQEEYSLLPSIASCQAMAENGSRGKPLDEGNVSPVPAIIIKLPISSITSRYFCIYMNSNIEICTFVPHRKSIFPDITCLLSSTSPSVITISTTPHSLDLKRSLSPLHFVCNIILYSTLLLLKYT